MKNLSVNELLIKLGEANTHIDSITDTLESAKRFRDQIRTELDNRKTVDPHEATINDFGYHDRALIYRREPEKRSPIVQGIIRAEMQANPGKQAMYMKLTKWNRDLLADEIITREVFEENDAVILKYF